MAKNGFSRADAKVSVHEGGYVNHPSDPGGATDRGVTQRNYDLYRKTKGLPQRTVRKMTEAERLDIYETRYWDVVQGDKLPPGVDYVVYDGAVNSGPSQSVKWLQRALGSRYDGAIDGRIGPATLAAVEDHPNHDALVRAICDRRLAFLQALRTWSTFGRGWQRRVDDVRAVGQAWAAGDVGPEVTYTPDGAAKAPVEDAKPAPSTVPGDVATTGGATGGGILGALETAKEQLTPFSSANGWIETVVVVLIVAGVVLAIGGVAYRIWAKRKAAERADVLDLPTVRA
jgi:lysozyme family protein